ncbi:hypothetical protein B0H14DRAFT_2631816 [Mycena olivaceomarginata]|nr:hypothetical protein B0H14DRAFT_2631816 [Mycena olivaceomarginata]
MRVMFSTAISCNRDRLINRLIIAHPDLIHLTPVSLYLNACRYDLDFLHPLSPPPWHRLTLARPSPPPPQQELGALVSKVTALSKLTLDMTRLCIEVNGIVNHALPAVVQGQVAAALAAAVPSVTWYHSAAPLPDEIDAMFPPGLFDNEAVACRVHWPPPPAFTLRIWTRMTKSAMSQTSPAKRKDTP